MPDRVQSFTKLCPSNASQMWQRRQTTASMYMYVCIYVHIYVYYIIAENKENRNQPKAQQNWI